MRDVPPQTRLARTCNCQCRHGSHDRNGASGLRSRMESLDLVANNVANASTGGYKADREFYSLYVSPEAAMRARSPPCR